MLSNMNENIFSDNKNATSSELWDSVRVLDWSGKPRYKILVGADTILTPFLVGQQMVTILLMVLLLVVFRLQTFAVPGHPTMHPIATLITGTLTTGNFIGAVEIGTTTLGLSIPRL